MCSHTCCESRLNSSHTLVKTENKKALDNIDIKFSIDSLKTDNYQETPTARVYKLPAKASS